METYIIRIYRRRDDSPEAVVGVSEHVETGEKEGFRSLTQLNRILLRSDPGDTQAQKKTTIPETPRPIDP
jgi:hypothetical protein